jgi:VWFA-related protein
MNSARAQKRSVSTPILRIAALFALIFVLFYCGVSRLESQGISEDEIRFGSRPFVPPSANAIHVQTNAVQVPVVVRDSQGKAVSGLKQADFKLFDNGQPVQIASFEVENAPPPSIRTVQIPQTVNAQLPATPALTPMNAPPPPTRYVALFFDDTSMRMFDVAMARKAAESFVKTSLRPGDRVGIFTTSTSVSLDFTDNVPRLLETIGRLLSHRKAAGGASSSCRQMNPYQASEIAHFWNEHSDAYDLARAEGCDVTAAIHVLGQAEQFAQDTLGIISDVIRYLGRMPGHRMLVLMSSGFLTLTLQEQQDKVIDEALNANVVINSLDAKGLVAEGSFEDGPPPTFRGIMQALYVKYQNMDREVENDPLAVLAEGTGGHFYHNRNDLDVGLKELATEPDVSYVLTYYPAALKRNAASHTLKVNLANSHGLNVSARRGYMAPSPDLSVSEKKKLRLDSAVMATDLQSALTAQVTTSAGKSTVGEPTLRVGIHLDANKLPFETQGDRRVERLIYITALFDEKNNFVTGVEGVMDLRLKPETMATLSSQGLDANLSLQAAPGNYRLRQVVQEVGNGRIVSINRSVEIR